MQQNIAQKHFLPYLFLLPAMIFIVIFGLIPVGYNFYISLVKWNFFGTKEFVGFGNYLALFQSEDFLKVLFNTFYFTLLNVPANIILSLLLALLLNGSIAGKKFFRALFFSPWMIPTVNVGILWMYILDQEYGMLNWLLGKVGIGEIGWLGSTKWALPAIALIYVWKFAGYYCVLYLAGLQNIPLELYEAAEIDGSSKWNIFWNITLPLLSPTTIFIMIVSLINSFGEFDLISVMTSGGPANSTSLLVYYLYERAFMAFKAGTASAVAVIILIILLTFTIIQFKLSKKWVHYR